MSVRTGARVAWSVWAVALTLTALALLLLYLNRFQVGVRIFQYWAENTVGAITFSTLGAVIVSRRPENLIGRLFCAVGLAAAVVHFGGEYSIYTLIANPGSLPGGALLAWLASLSLFLEAWLAITFLFLLFPDGRLPTPRWRPLAWLAVGDLAAILVLVAFAPGPLQEPFQFADNPVGIEGAGAMLDMAALVALPVLYVIAFCSLISLVLRFRRLRGDERQQIKWFAYAGAATLFMLFVFPGVLDRSAWGESPWAEALESGAVVAALDVGLPVAVGMAVLRYRLYDIDLIINRTLVYATLTVTLAAVYFGTVLVLQRLFIVLSGESSTLAVVASTLAIAALFVPLRRRIQRVIDRRFYRRKYDAARTLEDFAARLRSETDLDALSEDLVRVVRETLQPEHVSVWLRSPEGKRW